MKHLIVLLAFASAWGQVDSYGHKANADTKVDMSAALSSRPVPEKASDPATCTEGMRYYNTTSHKGRICVATNTWADEFRADANGWLGIGITPAVPLHVYSTRSASGSADSQIYSDWEAAVADGQAVSSMQGYFLNTGAVTSATAHVIGALGKGMDTTAGRITLFGVEGRVDGRATAGTHGYVGLIGASIFQGSAKTAYNYGVESKVDITTDGSTPLAQGIAVAFMADPIVGGDPALKYSFYGSDLIYSGGFIGAKVSAPKSAVDAAGTIRAQSDSTAAPSTGKGVEISYPSGLDLGMIVSVDHSAPAYKPLIIQSAQTAFFIGGTQVASYPYDGGHRLATGTRGTCDQDHSGTTFYVAGGDGVKDTFSVCAKDASNVWAWRTIY